MFVKELIWIALILLVTTGVTWFVFDWLERSQPKEPPTPAPPNAARQTFPVTDEDVAVGPSTPIPSPSEAS